MDPIVARRIKVPFNLQAGILYKSAWTCCVCRDRRISHIHHLDGNPSNNAEENLVGICGVCHDEAHTVHKLSQNLTSERIRDAKLKWETEVAQRTLKILAQARGGRDAIWSYINHGRLNQFLAKSGCEFDSRLLKSLIADGLVDKFGVPQRLQQPSAERPLWTVYDWLPFPKFHQVHALNADAVDCIANNTAPLIIDVLWQRKLIKALVRPGQMCFCVRAFYFKTVMRDKKERFEERLAYSRKRRIKLQLRLSTRDMFGSSSVHESFAGHRSAAALFVVKSIDQEGSELLISGTPIALGIGFDPLGNSPYASANVPTKPENPVWRLTSEWLYDSSK